MEQMLIEILVIIGWVWWNIYDWLYETEIYVSEGGASQNPCSETYAGPEPFSEPETRALSDFIGALDHEIDIYLAFHSYGHYILFPYGHTIEPAENVDDLVHFVHLSLYAFKK